MLCQSSAPGYELVKVAQRERGLTQAMTRRRG